MLQQQVKRPGLLYYCGGRQAKTKLIISDSDQCSEENTVSHTGVRREMDI